MATRIFKLTNGDWTDLGLGPAFLGAHGDELYFAIGEDPPPQDEVGHIVRFESNPVMIPAQERIWARALPGGHYARAVITALESAGVGSPVSAKNFR